MLKNGKQDCARTQSDSFTLRETGDDFCKRTSCGIENADDIIADLRQAMDAVL